ncbi:DNA cytosine methyltransferase [Amycolatopsis pittospori]|uniref:DNA cytosine methyltransferase n=1 Tax=Amycolatopsis pittospori TaxID=2749434 RepID=UPI0015F0472C|nr:DNA cytosine methyltransferase [Amycolatopsis pittospori]
MARKRILDACCCAGGAGKGYHNAGFDVVGVDIEPQPNYPYDFHQGDAIEFIRDHGHEFDAVHISPPCQNACALTAGNRRREGWTDSHMDLIPAARAVLADLHTRTGIPTVMENVQGSRLRRDLVLCGLTFGLRVFRHRYFEINGITVHQPTHPTHRGHRVAGWRHGVRHEGDMVAVYGDGGGKGSIADWQNAMGIHHTDVRREIAEAIPPAYTHHIGEALHTHLTSAALPIAA